MKNFWQKIKNKKGFVILFAVTLASIILTISLGVANIAWREVRFGTNAKDTNDAFFASDTAVECALFNDKPVTKFPLAGPATAITCTSTTPTYSGTANTGLYTFAMGGLGNSGVGCAKVTVFKDGATIPPFIITTVVSKGYNAGGSAPGACNPPTSSIEREIRASY